MSFFPPTAQGRGPALQSRAWGLGFTSMVQVFVYGFLVSRPDLPGEVSEPVGF